MRVLIADDDVISRRVLEATLAKWSYEVVVTCTGTEAWEILQRPDTPRLAILDWMMPGMDGIDICRRLRQRAQEPYIYILLLTARSRKEDVIVGLESGADDFLTKPFHPYELQARLRAGIRILDLQAELIAAREDLRVQATHDPLTGLWNRTAILDALNRELERATREGSPVALIMVDLDHFKQVNDTYGHMVGDAVLSEVARRMRMSLRPYDAIGRYGGEEFLIVLPGCHASDAMKLADRLHASIGGEAMEVAGEHIVIAGSLGVVTNREISQVDAGWFVRAADSALYRAKTHGRNRVELATAGEVTAAHRDMGV